MKKIITLLSFIFWFFTMLSKTTLEVPKGFGEQKNNRIDFVENKGQFHDQNYLSRPDVLFGSTVGNLNLLIKDNGISYQLSRVDSYKEVTGIKTGKDYKEIEALSMYRIDLTWLNANKNFSILTDSALPGCTNYYTSASPEEGALNVKSYRGIHLMNLYKGINLHYYEKNGELKHDYIVAPHSNYKQIQLELKGAEISINKDGSINFKTPIGNIQEGAPIVFQNGKRLQAKWQINGNILSFEINNYNPNFELIIDPITRIWGTYYGGTFDDYAYSCCTDALGNIILSGFTNSSNNIATSGAHQTNFMGVGILTDAFIVKFNNNGIRQWGTYFGGTGDDKSFYCCVDGMGNLYMTGVTGSNSNIASVGAHQTTYGGGPDAFLVKFNGNGVKQWCTYYGGIGSDVGSSCITDANGDLYIAGSTTSTNNISSAGAHQSNLGFGKDAFLVKFDNSGVRQWATYYGGTQYIDNGDDDVLSCKSDMYGNIYISGFTQSSNNISTIGAFQTNLGGNSDAFLVKFNNQGTRQWGTYYGDTAVDMARSSCIDNYNNIYITGVTSSNANISSPGSFQDSLSISPDAFLVKFNGSGIRQWATYYGDKGQEWCFSCFTDLLNNVYITGSTTSTINISSSGAYQPTLAGSIDAFLAKFDSTGIRKWGTYYGGQQSDESYSCAVDSIENIFIAGKSNSTNGIASAGAHQVTNSPTDAFLIKFRDCASLSPTASVNNTLCSGETINLFSGINSTISPTYFWNGPNSFTSNIQNPIINNASTVNIGTYTVTVDDNGCIENTTAQILAVYLIPTITVASATICSGELIVLTANGANTYSWNTGNTTSTLTSSPPSTTNYTVVGTSNFGCSNSATCSVEVIVCTGISNNAAESLIKIFPNPSNGLYTIEIIFEAEMILRNQMGKKLFEMHCDKGISNLDFENISNGVYYLNVISDTNVFNIKLIKN